MSSYDGTVGCGHADPAGLVFVKPGPALLVLAVAGPTLSGLLACRRVATAVMSYCVPV
jgi:hypothetical protein